MASATLPLALAHSHKLLESADSCALCLPWRPQLPETQEEDQAVRLREERLLVQLGGNFEEQGYRVLRPSANLSSGIL